MSLHTRGFADLTDVTLADEDRERERCIFQDFKIRKMCKVKCIHINTSAIKHLQSIHINTSAMKHLQKDLMEYLDQY